MKNVIVVALMTTILFVGCNGKKTKKDTQKQENEQVTVAQWGQEKYLIYLPFYLAQEKGFFKEQGLDIKIKFSGNDDQVFATVIKGEALFGIGDPVFTAISREKGGKGKVVASIVNGVALWGIARKDSKISEISNANQLKGLKIGTFPKPSTTYTLVKNTIDENNLKGTKVVETNFGAQIAVLESNNADIVMDLEPGASIAESKGYKIVYSLPKFYGDFSFTGLTTIEQVIESKPKTVQKMVNAIEEANVFAHQNIDETVRIAQTLFPKQDPNVIKKAVYRMINENTIPPHAFTSLKGWNKAIDVRVQVGDLKTKDNTDLAIDNSFAIKAQKTKKDE